MQKVKFTHKNSHQGDVQLFEIEKLPNGIKKIENRFIAKSEQSGHVHVMVGDYEMYEKEGVDGVFIKVGTDGCTLNHTGLINLTPEKMKINKATEIADHKPNVYAPNTILYIGIQRRKKHFSKIWQKVKD